MSKGLEYGEEASRRVEAIYMTPDVVSYRCGVLEALALREGERVLDMGSGPGFLAYDMGLSVGSSGKVVGTDVSESMLGIARKRCADLTWVEFQTADATKLPFADGEFDVAVSTQVLEYVRDVDAALGEIHRVLKPGGRAVILDTDWDSIVWHSSDKERMDKVLKAWDEHLADPYLPRTLAPRLQKSGLSLQGRRVFPMFNPEYQENTYSHGVIGLIAAFVEGRNGLDQKEVADWAEDLRRLGETGEYFFSLNRYLFLAGRPL